jgi:hypothetical protein
MDSLSSALNSQGDDLLSVIESEIQQARTSDKIIKEESLDATETIIGMTTYSDPIVGRYIFQLYSNFSLGAVAVHKVKKMNISKILDSKSSSSSSSSLPASNDPAVDKVLSGYKPLMTQVRPIFDHLARVNLLPKLKGPINLANPDHYAQFIQWNKQ